MIQGQGQPLRSPKGQNLEKTANFIENNCQNRLFSYQFLKKQFMIVFFV